MKRIPILFPRLFVSLSLSLFPALALMPPPASAEPPSASAARVDPSAPARVFSTVPIVRPKGGKWRIGYYESGDYGEYPVNLRAIAEGLQTLGWLGLPPIPEGLSGEALWRFLAKNTRSDTLEFVGDAYWKPGDFDENLRSRTMNSFAERLKKRRDLDLVIAMGTWAGQDLAKLGTPIPTVVTSASDPLEAGIIQSPEDSGQDNLHARIDPERYQRELRLFHSIVPFETLGIVYEDSPEGRSYAAINAIQAVSRERGFTVVSCLAPFSGVEAAVATRKALDCYREIAPRVDAVYVTTHRGITPASIRQVSAILRRAQTPSFSMEGSEEVRAGILMCLAESKRSYLGLFYAEVIARVFNGAKPRELNQILADPAKIALNLETTRQIGFDPPVDILLAADEVYENRDAASAPEK
ncbi:MAG: hypothetical protein LBE85_02235 [Candidatus Accumulibacter sp.]|jgi:ABC-type uncharacterized transport system substrate-binding protein|nr:hypothetical protein [Accumulibacter sp.]